MDLSAFIAPEMGSLARITGSHHTHGDWEHRAFIPAPLPNTTPKLSAKTMLSVTNTRATLAALNTAASKFSNPAILRKPTMRREAHSTSALEGTYAPFREVLTADTTEPQTIDLREILNYEEMAETGYGIIKTGRHIGLSLITDLHSILMQETAHAKYSGRIRNTQVVIGKLADTSSPIPVHNARFVPPPPGYQLETGVQDLLTWMRHTHKHSIDPLIAAAMAHYQFETLHPFTDGNGRIGRFLICAQLMTAGILAEPVLSVSPWFEARRAEYYDRLLAVSTVGDWDGFISFFADGINYAAEYSFALLDLLTEAQADLQARLKASNLRSPAYSRVLDFATTHLVFKAPQVAKELSLSAQNTHVILTKLTQLGLLEKYPGKNRAQNYCAPDILRIILADE